MVAVFAPPPAPGVVRYFPRGAARDLLARRDKEALIEGPAGTGKSYAALWKLHACALKYPGMRALMVRKTLTSLTGTAIVTYRERVLGAGRFAVKPFGGSRFEAGGYQYANGSRLVVGGIDNPDKIMGGEYDLIFVNEATELAEDDWEKLATRNRYGVMPYQQLIADANPGAPTHWLNQRCETGQTARLRSTHRDNPRYWDAAAGDWTEAGRDYVVGILGKLTGVRRLRLLEGVWAAAEGQVYDAWREDVHHVDALPPSFATAWHFAAVDWGWTDPGVIGVWAVDGDGRVALVAEHYHTRRLVEGWWIERAKELGAEFAIREWHCDPSEPAYLNQFRRAGLRAVPAVNDIMPGVTAVQDRLAVQPDGLPRLFVLRSALRQRDEALVAAKQPWSTVQEIPEYVWPKDAAGRPAKDRPVDENNHGMDMMRYAVARLDLRGRPSTARAL
ncbi:MAG: phage terminase large subunit [Chloroflexota bacterium]|nr:phage terminase large subunit [Chloroflexota bacterium]